MLAIDSNPLDILNQKKYNTTQAAAALGMSRTHLNRLRAKGDAPNEITIAGKVVFLEKELERWIIDQNPKLKEQFEIMESAKNAIKKQRAKKTKLKAVK